MSTRSLFAAALGILLLLPAPAGAQEAMATIRGIIRDDSGAPAPGIAVRLVDASGSLPDRTVISGLDGSYRLLFLSPATTYLIKVDHPGFAALEIGPIQVEAGSTTVHDISLQSSAALTEHIQVEAAGVVVDTTSTSSSTIFNSEYIQGLPLIGRSYSDLLTLTPGVTDADGDGNPNVQGARDTGLQYRLDGANITDPMSGTIGQSVNLDVIDELEVITAGAGAQYGRADGGFANIITRSGGNRLEGAFRAFWRGRFLDGDGAGENQDTIQAPSIERSDLRNLSLSLSLGGPIRRDRLWYFVAVQTIDRAEPLSLAGLELTRRAEATNYFAKLSWQVHPDHRLDLTVNGDPTELRGELLDFGYDLDSDAVITQGGRTTQLRWTAIVSPTLLSQTSFSYYDAGISYDPVSDRFHRIHLEKVLVSEGSRVTLQARYPRECRTLHCDPRTGNHGIYQIDLVTGGVYGPYPNATDDSRTRASIRSDFDRTADTRLGEHRLKSGFEFAEERFGDDPITNPYLVNNYRRCSDICAGGQECPSICLIPGFGVDEKGIIGFQVLASPEPVSLKREIQGFNLSAYVQDSWLVQPNLSIQIGLRVDHETIDTAGFTPFHPRDEKLRQVQILEGLCADGLRVSRFGDGRSNADSAVVCDDPARTPGEEPKFNLKYWMDEETPEELRPFDVNRDGIYDTGVDGSVWREAFTSYEERSSETFSLTNLNLAPRFAISWDPWADGKTKLFTTWGRYYDRLFLDTADDEMGPDTINYLFIPGIFRNRIPNNSLSERSSASTVIQIDRDMRTPFTDVFTLGLERELAADWAFSAVYTQRLAWDLLQDVDLNHVQCVDFPIQFDIKKRDVCRLYTDSSGKAHLSEDMFGQVVGGEHPTSNSNRAPDLYIVNPNFNQVLRLGNYNSSSYRSVSLAFRRRLHRSWQAQVSYTWSRAYGQAEEFLSLLGNDPSTRDDEEGFLDYDQTHRVIVTATTHLPRNLRFGAVLLWETGTPFSAIRQIAEQDDDGNIIFRTFYPSEQRNDQRNGPLWRLDLRAEKSFTLRGVLASASLAVNNLFNDDDVTLAAYRARSYAAFQLEEGPQGLRRFGRIWELGLSIAF